MMEFIKTRGGNYKVFNIGKDLMNDDIMNCIGKIKYTKVFNRYSFYPSFFLICVGVDCMLEISEFISTLK